MAPRVLTGVPVVGAGRPDSGALVVVARPVGMGAPVAGVVREVVAVARLERTAG
ncbi:hypothetical protein [Actinokineospora sp. HUAS TT18]|uniref:hypothetical protein n=1 Tax=Actinokineospora sp. HUAS TT18 TaxID=3447451 RepID=UPI003F52440E